MNIFLPSPGFGVVTVRLAIVYRQADIHCSLTRELCEVLLSTAWQEESLADAWKSKKKLKLCHSAHFVILFISSRAWCFWTEWNGEILFSRKNRWNSQILFISFFFHFFIKALPYLINISAFFCVQISRSARFSYFSTKNKRTVTLAKAQVALPLNFA